jgi:hypothetical protein
MKIKLLVFIILSIGLRIGNAQVSIQFSPMLANMFMLDEINNVIISNNTNDLFTGHIEFSINMDNSGFVMSINSQQIVLAPGINAGKNKLNFQNSKRFGTNKASKLLRQTGLLPEGNYTLCYKFIDNTGSELAVNCQESFNTNLGPPELLFPLDRDVLETLDLLSWKPPTSPIYLPIDYKLIVVKKNEKNPFHSSISNNPQILNEKIHSKNEFLIIQENQLFEREDTYLWQIEAFYKGISLGKSSIWEFSFSKEYIANKEVERVYRKAKSSLDGGYFVANNELNFTFENYENYENFQGAVFLKDSGEMVSEGWEVLLSNYGLNKIDYELSNLNLEEGNRYVFHLRNTDKQTFFIEFEVEQ